MTEADFEAQLESAKTEAMKSFGDQVMLLEKYVVRPRYVFNLKQKMIIISYSFEIEY